MFKRITYTIFSGFFFLSSSAYAAITTSTVNDFQSGTVEGWTHQRTSSALPVIAANDGPSGTGDFSLRVSANGGGGVGSRLLAFNRDADWTGAAGSNVTGLEMDLKHISASDLNIRIGISNGTGRSGTWFVSNTAHTLSSANSGNWEHALFAFSDLVQLNGSDSLATVLENIAEVRILHSLSPDFKGDSINAALAVDNVSAVPVPAAVWLFASAIGFLGLRRYA